MNTLNPEISQAALEIVNEQFKETSQVITAYRGSIAHGMYIPNSDPNSIDDIDLISVVLPNLDHYFGLREWGSRGTKEVFSGCYDIVGYEFKKMISLLSKANPNVLSILWLDDKYYLHKSPIGNFLIANRDLFVSKRLFSSFCGYAHNQLHRMNHSNPNGFMKDKKKQLLEKFGYNCKNAAHLMRLLKMGIEFAECGELHVDRTNIDAKELLDIKNGLWSLEKVKKEAEYLFIYFRELESKSTLPDEPDYEKINKMCVNLLSKLFYNEISTVHVRDSFFIKK